MAEKIAIASLEMINTFVFIRSVLPWLGDSLDEKTKAHLERIFSNGELQASGGYVILRLPQEDYDILMNLVMNDEIVRSISQAATQVNTFLRMAKH